MTKDNLERLAFPQLTEEQLLALAKFTTLTTYQAGQTLFSAGDSGFKFFVIKQGEVEIVENTTGKQVRVIIYQEREFTGDISMLTGSPSPVTAFSVGGPMKLYKIGQPWQNEHFYCQ